MSDLFQEDNWSHLVSFGRHRNYIIVLAAGGAGIGQFSYSVFNGGLSDPDGSAALRYVGNFSGFDEYVEILPNRPDGVTINLGIPLLENGGFLVFLIPYRENPLGFPGSRTLEEALLKPPPAPAAFHFPLAGVPTNNNAGGFSAGESYTVHYHTDGTLFSGWTSNGVFYPVSWVGI